VGRVPVFADLAHLALTVRARDEAMAWLDRGRRDEPAHLRAQNALRWDMAEIRLLARAEPPETWVPRLAVALERHAEDKSAGTEFLSTLMDMGLLRTVPHPDRPGEILLDSRPLQALLAEYGPRVTTAAGQLGVSATSGGIWTPDREAGGQA